MACKDLISFASANSKSRESRYAIPAINILIQSLQLEMAFEALINRGCKLEIEKSDCSNFFMDEKMIYEEVDTIYSNLKLLESLILQSKTLNPKTE